MTEKDIYDLASCISRYIDGSADDSDIRRINEWRNASDDNSLMFDKFSGEEFIRDIGDELKLYDSHKAYESFIRRKRNTSLKKRIRTVAAVLLPLLIAGGLVFLFQERNHTHIPPDNAIILTLSNDQQIRLHGENANELRDQEQVFRNDGESINYAETGPNNQTADTEPICHTLTVPRGKEYTVIFSDGSSVKLNAQSKLKYSVPFADDKREVTITGEAYFRISPDAGKPFIVKTANYDIHVTGTQFNVRSYPEDKTATTLVNGSVQIKKNDRTYELTPGQQAVETEDGIEVNDVVIDSYIAWEHGEFLFAHQTLDYIMSEISKWYDIEIFFEEEHAKELIFSAGFRKSMTLEEILETLEYTGNIKFRISKDRIKVMYNE